jgi:fructoselysine-6-P-deglycase FrlB-like protein
MDLPVAPARVSQWTFAGRGWTVGLASEAALKLREAAQAWTEAYPALE